MINYDQNINARDIINYWSNGTVLLEHKGSWSGYSVIGIEESESTRAGEELIQLALTSKEMTYGTPPNKVALTRPNFFKKAILHRPRLGVVRGKDGIMYLLSWAPGRGDMNKAIQKSDVVFKILDTSDSKVQDDWQKRYSEAGNAWDEAVGKMRRLRGAQRDYRRWRQQLISISNTLHRRTDAFMVTENRLKNGGGRGSNKHLHLAIQFLNFKPVSLKEAYKACLEKGAAVIKGTLWLRRRDKGDVVLVVNGDSTIGYLSKTLQHHPVFDYKNPQKSRINRQLLTMLLEDK